MYKHYRNPFVNPFIRFVVEPGQDGGGDGGEGDLGFPKDTPTDQMTDAQKAAYWHNQSKVQQKAREEKERALSAYQRFGSVEELEAQAQAAADAAEAARVAALSEAEKAAEAARAEGRAAGEAAGAGRHLQSAVTGMLIAHTKGANESFEDATKRVAGAIQFADLTKFVGEDGNLDAEKVQTFAQSIGSAGGVSNENGGPGLLEVLSRQSTPTPGSPGSVAAMESAFYDRLKAKTN